MVDINSAQQLVDLLLKAGDRLVIIDFYSPGCGGCKPLHPKVWYIAMHYAVILSKLWFTIDIIIVSI